MATFPYKSHSQKPISQFVYTCSNCKKNIETRYHCHTCKDFDLCISCYPKDIHPHRMDRMGLGKEKKLTIERYTQSLVHVFQCYRASCRSPSCQRMKHVVRHAEACKKNVDVNCPVCKQLMTLCFYHAKYCTNADCDVPICSNIKQKIKILQQQRSRLRSSRMFKK